MKKQKSIPKGIFSRASRIISATTQLAAKEASLKIKKKVTSNLEGTQLKTRIDQAIILRDTLTELKGAAMKFGQILSIDVNEYLPPEVTKILSELQAQSQAFEYGKIQEVLSAELNEKLYDLEDIQPEPLASASIGQVHRARLARKEVVLKVQYPGVSDSIPSDMKLLKRVLTTASGLVGKKVDLGPTLDEIEYVLKLETQYLREMQYQQFYFEKFKDHELYQVPAVFEDHCTSAVLCTEYIEALSLNEWIESEPSLEDRLKIAIGLLDLFHIEFFDYGKVQTDPNHGNFLIQTNPLKLVLLDFGATLEYDKEFIKEYRDFAVLAQSGTVEEVFEAAVKFELLDRRESPEVAEKFHSMMYQSGLPFNLEEQPFDFTRIDYERSSRQAVIDFSNSLKYSPPPRRIIFLHRKLGGLFATLKKMKVSLDLSPYWHRLTSYDF